MITRRFALALPLMAVPLRAQPVVPPPIDALSHALAICWTARGTPFTPEAVAQRIGARTGKAALLAVAGAATSADGEEVETAVEIVWEAGAPPSPAYPLMQRDLARGLPLLLITRDGRALLLHSVAGTMVVVRDPLSHASVMLDWGQAVLIGRPVIAGA